MKYFFNNEKLDFLYIGAVEVLKELKIIKEGESDEFFYLLKESNDKNELNRKALLQYKQMYGIEPFDKTAFYRLLSYIIREDCVIA